MTKIQEMKEKFDKTVGMVSVLEVDLEDGTALLHYNTITATVMTIRLYATDNGGWKFGGYEENFQYMWKKFSEIGNGV